MPIKRKQTVSKKHAGQKHTTSRKAPSRKTKKGHTGTSSKRHGAARRSRSKIGDATYLFECTRQGCGYRIVREEKAEAGQLRFDLKCPKCHNREFKCLGQGDLPQTGEFSISSATIDFDNIRPVDLGSN